MKKILLSLMSGILLCSCQTNPYALDSATYHYQLNGTPISISFNAKEKRFSGKVVNNYFGTVQKTLLKDEDSIYYISKEINN